MAVLGREGLVCQGGKVRGGNQDFTGYLYHSRQRSAETKQNDQEEDHRQRQINQHSQGRSPKGAAGISPNPSA